MAKLVFRNRAVDVDETYELIIQQMARGRMFVELTPKENNSKSLPSMYNITMIERINR